MKDETANETAGEAAKPPVLTLARASELLAECVEERGKDYVYPPMTVAPTGEKTGGGCYYMHTAVQQQALARACGKEGPDVPDDAPPVPGCLIGTALHKFGVPLERMIWITGADDLMMSLNNRGLLSFEPAVVTLFSQAQAHQDAGDTWGSAVQRAERWLDAHGLG